MKDGFSSGTRRWLFAAGVLALAAAVGVIGLLPLTSNGQVRLGKINVGSSLNTTVTKVTSSVTTAKRRASQSASSTSGRTSTRQTSVRAAPVPAPQGTPPLHGAYGHGQGTVAVVDTNPSPVRPFTNDTTGKDNNEDIVVGRSRAEQRPDGTYHGHITVAALLGNEIVGVDAGPGQTQNGPLQGLQQILDGLCGAQQNQICVTLLQSNTTAGSNSSASHFKAAHVTLGGAASGIDAGAAESNGTASNDANCQTTHGDSKVATANVGGQKLVGLSQSTSDSQACNNGTPSSAHNTSSFVQLGGQGVPITDAGCGTGNPPNTGFALGPLLAVACNSDDTNGAQAAAPYGVREALDVFALTAGGSTALLKATTAASETHAIAPPTTSGNPCPPTCPPGSGTQNNTNTGTGNNGNNGNNGPGAGTGNNRSNGNGLCNVNGDNDCVTGNGPFGPRIPEGSPEDIARDCAEGVTFEGPQNCPANAAVKAHNKLAFTGTNLVGIALAGMLLLAGGLAIRRRLPTS
jgi:hypothetical protein